MSKIEEMQNRIEVLRELAKQEYEKLIAYAITQIDDYVPYSPKQQEKKQERKAA